MQVYYSEKTPVCGYILLEKRRLVEQMFSGKFTARNWDVAFMLTMKVQVTKYHQSHGLAYHNSAIWGVDFIESSSTSRCWGYVSRVLRPSPYFLPRTASLHNGEIRVQMPFARQYGDARVLLNGRVCRIITCKPSQSLPLILEQNALATPRPTKLRSLSCLFNRWSFIQYLCFHRTLGLTSLHCGRDWSKIIDPTLCSKSCHRHIEVSLPDFVFTI